MSSRKLQIPLVAVAAVLLAGPPALVADTLEVSIHPTTNTATASETTPTLGFDGITNVAVYTSRNADGLGNIFYQRISATGVPMAGGALQVSSSTTDDRLNDVSGSYIVYTALDPSDALSGLIKLYDIRTGGTIDLIPGADTVSEARIHGDIVAWVQGAPGLSRIEMVDLGWPMLSQITISDANPASAVEVGSRFVVWEEFDGTSSNIMAYDLWAGAQVNVATDPSVDETTPATFGHYVVWKQGAGSGSSLWARDIVAGGPAFLVADHGAVVRNPSIDGDLVAYESYLNANFDVYLYRISDGATFQVTGGAADEILNNVYGSLVAFVDVRATQMDIAIAHLTFVPDPPVDPCAALGGDPDGDGVCSARDNCPDVANPDQGDVDGDGVGDVCDSCGGTDTDGDGDGNLCDACPNDPANDADGDGVCAPADNCPTTANADQLDLDSDGTGDACDACPVDAADDADGDGVCAPADNCPDASNPDQADADEDGIGDACDDMPSCSVSTGLLAGLAVGHTRTVVGSGIAGWSGDGGPAAQATLNLPHGVALDASGHIHVADTFNSVVRRVDAVTGIITTIAGNGSLGFGGDGGPATEALLSDPRRVALDAGGSVFIGDIGNGRVRRVDAATGIITTVAGGGAAGPDEAVPATEASLIAITGLAFDSAGDLFIVEVGRNRIRRVAAGADGLITGADDEIITTAAGAGVQGFSGDDGPAISARFSAPEDLAFDLEGNLFVADRLNHRIRRVSAGLDGRITGAADEVVTTIAGGGATAGDGLPATTVALNLPRGITTDRTGNVFISEAGALRVRRVDAATGIISTVSGAGANLGEDILAATARVFNPRGLATDFDGNLFVAEQGAHRIRAVRLVPPPADTQPPVTVADVHPVPVGGWNNAPVTVTLTADDGPGCGVAEIHYSINGGDETVVPGATVALRVTAEGATSLSYFAVDAGGNVEPLKVVVINIDSAPPVLGVPAAVVTNATQPGGAVVTYVTTTSDALSGVASAACAPASGSLFPIGTTQVTCTASDLAGNATEAGFAVTVRGAAEQIVDLLELLRRMPFSPLLKARLTAVLQAALADPHNTRWACEILRLFIALVQHSQGIPADLAAHLAADATRIRAVLGC